ncbi:MAG: zinc ribbon domain-containing protein, partial [Erysipelotrichaceae bacterium]|nr:zinc ribbon domain-containing protein [Erysipelotrichaceae bacterium]
MFCKKCGYELGSGDVFCPKCGTKTSVPPQPAPAPQYTQPASVPPAPQPGPVMNAQPVSPAPAPQPQPAVQPQSSAGMPQAASSLALDIETICRKTGIDQTLWLIILGCSALILLLAKSAPLILAFGPFALGVGVICYLDNARKKAGPVNPQIPSYSGQPTPSPYAQPAQPAPEQAPVPAAAPT